MSATRDIQTVLREQVIPAGASRHGLVVGVERYRDARLNLRCARADAQAIYDLMTDAECGLFPKDNVKLLLDEEATKENIWRSLSNLRKAASPADMVWIFFAGHAAPEGTSVYWVTHDADVDDLFATALEKMQVERVVNDIRASRVIVMLDCCHAAATAVQRNPTRATLTAEELFSTFKGEGRITLASSDGCERSVELADQGHGAFTYYLKQGLRGDADSDGDGVVTANELWGYLRHKVTEASIKAGNVQTPVLVGQMTHDLALTLNPMAAQHKRQLEEVLRRHVGWNKDEFTTDEAEWCRNLVHHGAKTDDERIVYQELERLIHGQALIGTIKQLVKAARDTRPAKPAVAPVEKRTDQPVSRVCPSCKKHLRIQAFCAGQDVPCPNCKALLHVAADRSTLSIVQHSPIELSDSISQLSILPEDAPAASPSYVPPQEKKSRPAAAPPSLPPRPTPAPTAKPASQTTPSATKVAGIRPLVYMPAAGLLGAIAIWLLTLLMSPMVSQQFFVVIPLLIFTFAVSFGIVDSLHERSFRLLRRSALMAIPVAIFGGFLVPAMFNRESSRDLATFVILGTWLTLVPGLSTRSPKRMVVRIFAGAITGFVVYWLFPIVEIGNQIMGAHRHDFEMLWVPILLGTLAGFNMAAFEMLSKLRWIEAAGNDIRSAFQHTWTVIVALIGAGALIGSLPTGLARATIVPILVVTSYLASLKMTKRMKPHFEPLAPAIAMQFGYVLWLVFILFVPVLLRGHPATRAAIPEPTFLFDIVVLALGLTWLVMRSSSAALILLLAYQMILCPFNILMISERPMRHDIWYSIYYLPATYLAVAVRIMSVILMIYGCIMMRRKQFAPDISPDDIR